MNRNVIGLADEHTVDFDAYMHPFLDPLFLVPARDEQPKRTIFRSFKSDDMFWITGRGPVYTFKHNPAPDLWNPGMLVNEWVLIDYGLFLVTGVESHRPMISPTNPYGDLPIGLLVRPQTNLPDHYHKMTAMWLRRSKRRSADSTLSTPTADDGTMTRSTG